jgi:hypothetical protein
VVVAGRCPGLALEDLQVQGYRGCGIKLDACEGDDRRPILLTRVRATAGAEKAPALLFRTDPDQVNRHITVRECRFEGPCQAAVRVAGCLSAVRFERNRFYKTGAGLLYEKANPAQKFYVTLASNTFCEAQNAVRFSSLPPAEHTHLEVTSNLFVRTRKLVQVDNFPTQPENVLPRWVWLEEGSKPAAPRQFRKTFWVPAGYVGSRATLDITCARAFTVWVNGEPVGDGELTPATRRVYAFDVTRLLRPGKNVVAVQGRGRVWPNGLPGPAALLAQLTYSSTGGEPARVFSNQSWRASLEGPAGWQQVHFDDSEWAPAKFRGGMYGRIPLAAQGLVWDSVVRQSVPGYPPLKLLAVKSNYRDLNSREGFPILNATPTAIALPTDPKDDAEFLRYPRGSLLFQAGPKKTPIGVPPLQ